MIQDTAWSPRFVASTTATAATSADVNAGTDTNKFITPAALAGSTPTLTLTDVILGTSGPSVKSSLSARARRQGLVFDGTAGGTIANAATIGTADFTIAVWMNLRSTAGSQFILTNSIGTSNFQTSAADLVMYRSTGSTIATNTNPLVANKTQLIVYTRSGTTGQFYVNGVAFEGTKTDANSYTTFSDIGGIGSSSPCNGTLIPYIYNRALSASEVVALYEAGAPSASDYASGGANNTSYITGANSTFSSDTGFWTKAFSASIGSGQCTLPSGGGVIYVAGLLVKGTKYRLSVNIITNDTSGLYVQNMSDIGYGYISGTGVKTFEFTASGSGAANFGLQNQVGVASIVIDDVTLVPIGLLLAPDAAQAGGGYVWNDQSGNLAQIVLPSSGVQWALPSVAGQRIRGTTSTNGNQQLLGASVLLPAECQITHVRARARTGTPTITIGTASGGAQIVASVALSTTWLNCTIALTGGIVSSADDIWIGSNSTDVVETDIAFQPLDF